MDKINNIEELGKEFDVLRIKYITEKHLEWLKNNRKHVYDLLDQDLRNLAPDVVIP